MARRPKKQKSNNTAILLIVGGGILVLLLAGCGVGGYFAFRSAKQVVAEASAKTSGADKDDGVAAADAFLKITATSTAYHAYQQTSPAYQSSTPVLNFYSVIDGQPLFISHTARKVTNAGTVGGAAPNRKQVLVYELSKPGSQSGTVTLTIAEQPGGGWKVDRIAVP